MNLAACILQTHHKIAGLYSMCLRKNMFNLGEATHCIFAGCSMVIWKIEAGKKI